MAEADESGRLHLDRGEAGQAAIQPGRHRAVLLRQRGAGRGGRSCSPRPAGELEITDLNNRYVERGTAELVDLGRGTAWLDTGTHDSLLEAGQFVQVLEHRQGVRIACLEEIALARGFIDAEQALAAG